MGTPLAAAKPLSSEDRPFASSVGRDEFSEEELEELRALGYMRD